MPHKKHKKTFIWLFLPISMLYGTVVIIIRSLYRFGFFKIHKAKLPVLKVGNLSVGGTGKTPHAEFLVNHFSMKYQMVILSRGYNRKTKGVQWVESKSRAEDVGDEPLQMKQKFPHVPVIVSEKRAAALPFIYERYPQTQLIILDDAMQHWALASTLDVLLTTYDRPFFEDYVLPMGRLREFRRGYKRADSIIITKCSTDISSETQADYIQKINPKQQQQVYFTYYEYGSVYNLVQTDEQIQDLASYSIIIITAIANTEYLEKYLNEKAKSTSYLKFGDHHLFAPKDIEELSTQYQLKKQATVDPTLIITTEKDATKLRAYDNLIKKYDLPIYVLPIKISFVEGQASAFLADLEQKLFNETTI